MSSTCNWCQAGLACREHPDAPRPGPPPLYGVTAPEATPPSKLPKSFHTLLPSQPITLAQSFDSYSSEERAKIVAKHLATTSTGSNMKRRAPESPSVDASPAPKQPRTSSNERSPVSDPRSANLFPVRPCDDKHPLISQAWDVWRCVRETDHRHIPNDVDLEKTIEDDAAFQRSKAPQYFRRPLGVYLRCIHCLADVGHWITWTNRQGGITGRIREHMEKRHPEVFLPRVARSYVPTTDDPDYSNLEYSPESFAKSLAQWIAVDDQQSLALDWGIVAPDVLAGAN
ncbi:hAT family dimerization protein [Ceratobasidium sp. AG-Ba]|nr:hAT family dimerization protein [Ceratobasidium sp. AG-Ba]